MPGIIKVLGPEDRPYYTAGDVMRILGVSISKAYSMIKDMRQECVESGNMTKSYPAGKIPKKYFDEVCMIE